MLKDTHPSLTLLKKYSFIRLDLFYKEGKEKIKSWESGINHN